MKDYLVKALDDTKHIRAIAVDATQLVREAQKRHDTWSASSAALGRTLIGTLLLSSAELQGNQKLTVRVQGNGPVGAIIADGTAKGTVKSYIQEAHVNLPLNPVGKIDVRRAVGTEGMLSVTKDLGFKTPFTGQVNLISGELAEDFTFYLAHSEQIPSAVGLSVFVNANNTIGAAGGFLIQALPGATDGQLQQLEKHIKALPLVSDLLRKGQTPEAILTKIFSSKINILEHQPVAFNCDCSKEKFGKIIASLDKQEISSMIEVDHGAEAVCKFCGNKYHYSEAELQEML